MTNSQLLLGSNFILSTTKTFTITDLTNYSAETYSDVFGNVKVYGPTGNQIHNNTSWVTPDIDISSSTTSSAFNLPSTAGVVPEGTYTFIYTSRIVDLLYSRLIVSNDSAAKTLVIAGNWTTEIATGASFNCVDVVTTPLTIVSSTYSSTTGNTTVTVGETLGILTGLATFQFTLTTDFIQTFTQNYTYATPSVCISVDIDNCCSSLTLTDITTYAAGATVTRLHTISYPQGMVTPIADIVSPLQAITVTPIWTGSWTDIFTADIEATVGIITVNETVRGVQTFTVTADQYDCQVSTCLQAVVNRYSANLTANPVEAMRIQPYLIQALGLVTAYQLAKRCGDENATTFLTQITALTVTCGCDCDCADCADDTPTQVIGCCETVAGSTNTILMTSSDNSITIAAVTVGDTTTFDVIVSSSWFNTTFLAQMNVTSINELSDVNTTLAPVVGTCLVWNGVAFTAQNPPTYLANGLDVDTTGLANTMYLYYDGGSSTFKFRLLTLDNLSDVIITAVANKDILQYNGSDWVNVDNNLILLSDVNTAGLANGDMLVWNAGTSKWIKQTPITTLAGLTDVDLGFTTPLANNDTFVYVLGTGWVNQAKPVFVTESNTSFNPAFDNSVGGYYAVGIRADLVSGAVTIRGVADNIAGTAGGAATIFTIADTGLWPAQEIPFLVTVGIGSGSPTIGGGAVSAAGVVSIDWYTKAADGVRTAGYPAGDIDLGGIPTWYV